jgi:hypothetical protein
VRDGFRRDRIGAPAPPPAEPERTCGIGDPYDPCRSTDDVPVGGGTLEGFTGGPSTHGAWCGGGFSPEDVFAWTPNVSGTATFSTCGSTFDTVLYVRTGSCEAYDVLDCNNDGCPSGLGSEISLYVTAGATYYVFVDGIGEQSGAYTLRVSAPGGAGDHDTCQPNECAGSGGTCFCDAECDVYGDCCVNACDACGSCWSWRPIERPGREDEPPSDPDSPRSAT